MWVFLCLISPTEFCSLALVDTWRFSKSPRSLDQQFTWKSRWGSFTLTHNRTKFDGHCRCETGDTPFWNITLSHDRWVRWLDGCGQLNLSHNLLKFMAMGLAKVEIKLFKKNHVIKWSMGRVNQWVRYPHPKSQRLW